MLSDWRFALSPAGPENCGRPLLTFNDNYSACGSGCVSERDMDSRYIHGIG